MLFIFLVRDNMQDTCSLTYITFLSLPQLPTNLLNLPWRPRGGVIQSRFEGKEAAKGKQPNLLGKYGDNSTEPNPQHSK